MGSTKEVVTLQFGHYANFIGTHWWNIQESSFIYDPKLAESKEVNPDVLFREGKNLNKQVTFTPRLILWDLKGSLHSLRKEGTLYDFRSDRTSGWDGDVTVTKKPRIEKNEFLKDLEKQEEDYQVPTDYEEMELSQDDTTGENLETKEPKEVDGNCDSQEDVFGQKFYNLDDSVQVWSDFLNIHLHPKSVNIINEFSHNSSELPFDIHGCGYQTMSATDTWTEAEDRLHFFTEECDQLQGFQMLVDTHDAFSGVATSVLEYLEDDFPGKSVLTFGTSPANFTNPDHNSHHILNTALCYQKLPSFSSLFIPLSLSSSAWLSRPSAHISYRKFPNAIYKPNLDYHTSAILAACLENSTLPYRLWNKSGHMKDITHSFHGLGRKVGALMAALPFPLGEDSSLVETFMQLDGEMPWTPVSPNISAETKPWMMSSVLRGISEELAMTSNIKPEFAQVLSHCSSVSDVLELFVTELFPGSLNAGCVVTAPCKVVTPYPHIFTPNINSGGLVSTMLRTPMQGVDSIPVMSCIQSTKESGKMVGELYEEAKKINIKRFHRFLSTGLEEDEFKETLNELANLGENYDD